MIMLICCHFDSEAEEAIIVSNSHSSKSNQELGLSPKQPRDITAAIFEL